MADVARNLEPRRTESEEQFWRPPVERRTPVAAGIGEACPRCGTEFIVGSRFCYVCGEDRDLPGRGRARGIDWKRWLDFRSLAERLGIGPVALVPFLAGAICLLAAALTGLMFTATTLLDWQAVQLWRIQWLLAAVALFAAGVLLKKAPPADQE